MNAKADPQAKAAGESDMQPIHIAALYCKSNIVAYFISKGVPIDAQTALGNQIIHIGARMADLGTLIECLKRSPDLVSAKNNADMQPLHCAAKSHDECRGASVKYLVEARADVFAADVNGHTPLDLAHMQEKPNHKVLSYLMEAQASLEDQAHDQSNNLDIQVLGGIDGEG